MVPAALDSLPCKILLCLWLCSCVAMPDNLGLRTCDAPAIKCEARKTSEKTHVRLPPTHIWTRRVSSLLSATKRCDIPKGKEEGRGLHMLSPFICPLHPVDSPLQPHFTAVEECVCMSPLAYAGLSTITVANILRVERELLYLVSWQHSKLEHNSGREQELADRDSTALKTIVTANKKGKRDIPEITHRAAVSSGTISACENSSVTPPGIEAKILAIGNHTSITTDHSWPRIFGSGFPYLKPFSRSQSGFSVLRDIFIYHFIDTWRKLLIVSMLDLNIPTSFRNYQWISFQYSPGAALAFWSYYSLPIKTNRFLFPAGVTPVFFARGNRAGRCRWLAGFLGDLLYTRSRIPALLLAHLVSPSLAFKTPLLKTVRLSPFHSILTITNEFEWQEYSNCHRDSNFVIRITAKHGLCRLGFVRSRNPRLRGKRRCSKRTMRESGRVQIEEQVTVLKDFVRIKALSNKRVSFFASDFNIRWQQAFTIEELFLGRTRTG
ncbi:hypothetical protein PR048_004445 [Dryococelus australis]|uniref:Uncharacterized protein n=1 Tax=Dryococelus australis TaxID=614101 RepID=A0ABQ9I5G0_9NEOP|nr:hypothetical protein PR048_004445 [Dryococelus australis]